MRSDWPAGFNEDCIEPPCEIFLQLFIENPDEGVGDIPIQDEEIYPLDQFGPAINDGDSDHGDDFQLDFNVDDVSSDLLSVNSDMSMHIVAVSPDTSSDSSISDSEHPEYLPCAEPHCEETSDTEYVVSDTSSEVWVCDVEAPEELSGTELHCKEPACKLSDEEASNDMWLPDENSAGGEGSREENSEAILELETSPLSSPVSQHCEDASNVPDDGTGNCEIISSHSRELPNEDEPPEELEPSSGSSSTSTHVSLYVVVPPTNISNEGSTASLSGHSSSNLHHGLIPVSQPYSTNPFKPVEIFPANDSHEICTCIEEVIALRKASEYNFASTKCDDHNSSNESVPDSDTDNSDGQVSLLKSENKTIDDMDLEVSVFDSNQAENTGLENEACSENFTDKPVGQKKRKVSTSSEDSVITKVPKYSETSTDSVNVQESVENYCKVLSSNSEKQMSSDSDRADIVPPAVAGDNVILTLGKAVEESSVVNEEPKSR